MQPSHFKHLKNQLKVRTTSFRMKDIHCFVQIPNKTFSLTGLTIARF